MKFMKPLERNQIFLYRKSVKTYLQQCRNTKKFRGLNLRTPYNKGFMNFIMKNLCNSIADSSQFQTKTHALKLPFVELQFKFASN